MPQIIIQTDNGVTVGTFKFPEDSGYALYQMPGCPAHVGVHNLLNWMRRTLGDTCDIQAKARRRTES